MKSFIFLLIFILSLSLAAPKPAFAQAQLDKVLLLQQIEILKHEIEVLKSLVLSLNSRKVPIADAFIAVRLSDNKVLLERNLNQVHSIASITKLMTSVVALENIASNQEITLTQAMLEPLGHSPSLFLGLNIGAENLLKAALIQSSNDAAEALTFFVGKENFLSLMNQKAKELGMRNTVFIDANGLHPGNHSTASDIVKLMSYIYSQHPEILQITKNNDFWLPDATGRRLKFQNENNFYPLGEFIGGKTGYLVEAKQTIASVFNVNQEPIAIILLYSDNLQADVFAIINQLKNRSLAQ